MEDTKYNANNHFAKAVRAGKRTYFFDVKSTRDDSLYLVISESKKRFKPDGGFYYEKHKVFLHKEDFIKFSDGLKEAITYIKDNNPAPFEEQTFNKYENGNQAANEDNKSNAESTIEENADKK